MIFAADCERDAESFIAIGKSYGSNVFKSLIAGAGGGAPENNTAGGGFKGNGVSAQDKKRGASDGGGRAGGGGGSTTGAAKGDPQYASAAQGDKQRKLGLAAAAAYVKVSPGKLAFGAHGAPFDTNKCAAYLAKHVPACRGATAADICGACLSTKPTRSERNAFCNLAESDPVNHGENGKYHALSPSVRECLLDFR